ncbi:MAG: hypothetical protein WAL56_05485 [Candidatus Sulfotelmatobacter sp.]
MIADLAGSTTTPIMWDTPNRELSYAGRWLSPDSYGLGAFDPSNSRNWNRYAYALNNPLRNIDPSGLDCITANEDGSFSEEGGDCPDVDPDNEYYLNCDGCLDNVTGGYRDSSGNLVLTNGDDSVAGVVGGGGDLTDGFGYSSTPGGTAFFGQGSGGPDFVQLQVSLGPANNGPCGGADCTAVQRSMLQMVWKPPLAALRQAAKGYLCGSSPANNIRNWTIEGGAKGTAVGAIAGGVTGTVLGTPVGGFFGAILGGLIDGTVTAGGGVFGGSAASVVCSSLGVYSGS